jgi:hypothetical protein
MTDLALNEWDALQALAGRVGLPAERVGLVRRRCEVVGDRPGSPYVLLAGRPDAGLELLLARWLAPEVAEQLLQIGDRPLVIGAAPGQVRPRLGAWPGHVWRGWGPGHLLAMRPAPAPPADVLAQLGSLGYLDQVVLVTRLSQPLHQQERSLARSLAALAATARVLIVAVPGEEPSEKDLAEVTAYAVTQMRQAGFNGRCLGAGVWFTGGSHRPGTVADVESFLTLKPDEVGAGRRGMTQRVMAEFLGEVRHVAERCPTPTQASVPDDECDRLARELGGFLADLGRELDRQVEKRHPWTVEALRGYALDAIRAWGAYAGIEGHWLKYVERLRPGTHASLLAEAQEAFLRLDYEAGSEPKTEAGSPAIPDRFMTEAKRLAVGLGVGVVAYLVVAALLSNHHGSVSLPGLVVTLLCYATLTVGAILGYGAGRLLFRTRPHGPQALTTAHAAAMHGWAQAERRLLAWVSARLRTRPTSPSEECQDLARRLGLEEIDP